MTYLVSENICKYICNHLQYDGQMTVAVESFLRAWMAKHALSDEVRQIFPDI